MKIGYSLVVLLSQVGMIVVVGSPADSLSEPVLTASDSSVYEDWPGSRQTGTAGTKTGGQAQDSDYNVGGNNYGGQDQVDNDYGTTWSIQDAAKFLFREGLDYKDFHDDFTYAECAQAEDTNSFNCYVESKYVRPYFVDLTYYPDDNMVEFEFIQYADS